MEQIFNNDSTTLLAPLEETTLYEMDLNFDFESFVRNFKVHVESPQKAFDPIPHNEILIRLLEKIEKTDFRELADFKDENESLKRKHYLICSIEEVLKNAQDNNWNICKHLNFIYLYNGAYWSLFDDAEFKKFLGEAAEKMGVGKFEAKLYSFRDQLFKQFLSVANLPKPDHNNDEVFINLKNGTFEISPEKQFLRSPNSNDFITYQLNFEYNQDAKSPLFLEYLNKVLPDIESQNILAEYLDYIFIKPSTLKLEKTLLLYGTGANGKSVFFEIVNAMLGSENVSSYSLSSLTDDKGYHRAMIANKLVNYASEISGKLEIPIFKQLVSGEPVEARLPYGNPFSLTNYAKLIFNCNELPKDVEQTPAFFRRFLIVPFDVEIPENEQDKELSKKIINQELSGVFNWVLKGLQRLLIQKNFTNSEAVLEQIELYKKRSDNVLMFLDDEGFEKSYTEKMETKVLFDLYRNYCHDNRSIYSSSKVFCDRLRKAGFIIKRKNYGNVVHIKKISF